MDEASTGLDPGARRELWQYILELREQEGVTVLLTSHILDEADKCDQLVLLHEGRVVSEGTPAQLKAKIGGDVVILEAGDPVALSEKIESRFQVRPVAANGTLRVESPTAIGSSRRLWKLFPARSTRSDCTNRRWKMCSCGRLEPRYGSVLAGG
jgi:ABC-2 type transport system ATP-binding protein